MKTLRVLGCRGIPARHGGFETFAERLSVYLVSRGWQITVYCQQSAGDEIHEDRWRGVRRVNVPVHREGPLGTVVFDWRSTRHAARERGLVLTLGYNTAIFSALFRLRGILNVMNMDGLEWKREKWTFSQRAWLWLNEHAGSLLANALVADHPEIARHHARNTDERKITMIPYGADMLDDIDPTPIVGLGLEPASYALAIARTEPENSILDIVSAFSSRRRGCKLVVLGHLEPGSVRYHRQVMDAASDEVCFLGAIYDPETVCALRFHARMYVHGHRVGGTNPSLVEALGAGNPVLAHDNVFNRWVAGADARYFADRAECEEAFSVLLEDAASLQSMAAASRARHEASFRWPRVLDQYETLLAGLAEGVT